MKRALFLDRDGIFNHVVIRNGIPTAPRNREELTPCTEMTSKDLAKIRNLGFLLLLATNQPDVERGEIPKDFVESFHEQLRSEFPLDAIYVCYASDHSHPCKKPNPGMLLQAAKDFSLSLSECFFLGDTINDIGAARRAGCRGILWNRPYNVEVDAEFRVGSLGEVFEILRTAVPPKR